MNARQHAAWLQCGGGSELIDDLLAERGLIAIPMGSTGGQMAGWFRKEVGNAADLAGMKVRIGGFAGKVLETRGAMVICVPKDNILEALTNGSLDAFEWIAPYDDEKFVGATAGGRAPISSVAPYYYFPAWWKGIRSCISSSRKRSSPPFRKPIRPRCDRRPRSPTTASGRNMTRRTPRR